MNKQPNNKIGQVEAADETGDARSSGLARGAEKWLDEHGNPDYEYLESLASQITPEALEELRAIADDHNVIYDDEVTARELVNRIILATQQEEGDESM